MCVFSHSNSNIVVVVGGSNIKVMVVEDRGIGCRCSVINVCRLDCRGSRWCLCSHKGRWCYCVVGWDSGVTVGEWGSVCRGVWSVMLTDVQSGKIQRVESIEFAEIGFLFAFST